MSSFAHEEFTLALLNADRPVPLTVTSHSSRHPARRFGVYRNNVVSGLINALRTRFPAVETIVGDEFFGAMARLFVTSHPPRSSVLMTYGEGFPAFIESFAPAAELPYLADVARLEAARTRAYHAADAAPVDAQQLQQFDPDRLSSAIFVLHPSVQIVRSRHPVVTIWAMNSGEAELRTIEDGAAEDALVIRAHLDVAVVRLPRGGAVFLEALLAGSAFADAVSRAGAECADFDLVDNLAGLLRTGALAGIRPSTNDRSKAL
jgi:hypothetical protein